MRPSYLGMIAATAGDPRRLVRFFLLSCLSALLLVLVAPGCGRSSLEPEFLSDGGTAVCGPSNCPQGCCDSSGICRAGQDVRACGSTGGRCSDCVATGFDTCTTSRVCARDDASCGGTSCTGCCAVDGGRLRCLSGTEPAACGRSGVACSDCAVVGRTCDVSTRACGATSCDSSNCAGCCVGDKCLTGDVATACGSGGALCDSCAVGQSCSSVTDGGGRCVGTPSCDPSNCAGCCNAVGQCVPGADATACGSKGQACVACDTTAICVPDGQPNARTCQQPTKCGPSNCPGCCVGNQCVVQTTPQACGANGQACTTCGTNQVCDALGTCVQGGECNPANCAGCCVGDICAVGTQNTACGAKGEACLNCANQIPQRVCQTGVCEVPACGPTTCPNGCCSGNTCVVGTQNNACGAAGGAACQDCSATNQVCGARQCRDKCSAANCTGCCQADNTCVSGIANNACGSGGATCSSCSSNGSFCNGLVVPRRCNDQQTTCPAPYQSCGASVTTPVSAAAQNVCTDAALGSLGTACTDGPNATTCTTAFAALASACQSCLAPFRQPFDQSAGLYACAASFVGANCRRATGCAMDCEKTSCDQCVSTSASQCASLVKGNGGQCRSYVNAANCANNALSAGRLCSPISYADFGQWFQAVGDHFCGNGP